MKLLQIYNFASHYRRLIYRLIDQEIGGDFCFGDKVFGQDDVKKMDYSLLKGKVWEVKNIKVPFGHYYKGVPSLIRANYDTYIISGETRCISTWLFLLLAKFYPGKRVYLWTHGWLGDEGLVTILLGKVFYSLCTGAFIYNDRSRELMIRQGINPSKLHTIYNSLDYDTQLQIRESLSLSDIYGSHFNNANKNIVFIGRLTKIKRFDLLIDAVFKLKQQGEFINVTFIGDGIERSNMERLVKERGIINQVWFYGACYDEIINAELIFNADLCVSPGNIGLTAMHVMMFGCPVITHDDFNHQVPEFEAVRNGVTGAFFHVGDSNSLANVISDWFSRHSNDREAVREACYKEIDSKWNPHNQISILKEVLNGNNPSKIHK